MEDLVNICLEECWLVNEIDFFLIEKLIGNRHVLCEGNYFPK